MTYQFDLNEHEFRLLREFIHEKYGIFFKDEKRSFLRMKLYPRVVQLGLGSFGDYYNFVKYTDLEKRELLRMISLLTNNETYFFRELPQLEVFRDHLLPELKQKKHHRQDKSLRIVSAGCSTGEEVYSLAMLTFETGSFFWGWNVEIIGIDINENALQTARRGVYYPRSFRMTNSFYRGKFFSENSGDFIAKDSIKQMSHFRYGNITEPIFWETLSGSDIIFCRNVLIYFSQEKVDETLKFFAHALNEGGYLLLGHSETITGMMYKEFEVIRHPETIIYRKRNRQVQSL